MKKHMTVVLTLGLMVIMGCSTHRLAEYHFPDLHAAATMVAPANPEIMADYYIHVDSENMISTFINLGTNAAKHAEVERTRDRLQAALDTTDIPVRIKNRVFDRTTSLLRFTPVDDYHYADLLFDVRIKKYGIKADGWWAPAKFMMDVEVVLYDIRRNIEVWKKHIHECEPVSGHVFGGYDSVGNIMTVMALSNLSEHRMRAGLECLANETADRIVYKLQNDYVASRGN